MPILITPALAQAAGGSPGPGSGGALLQLLPFVAIFAIMYYLIIRPQQKRMKEHREMVDALQRGDVVVTAGGLIGKVIKLNGENEITVEIADGVRVKVVKGTVSELRSKGRPVKAKG